VTEVAGNDTITTEAGNPTKNHAAIRGRGGRSGGERPGSNRHRYRQQQIRWRRWWVRTMWWGRRCRGATTDGGGGSMPNPRWIDTSHPWGPSPELDLAIFNDLVRKIGIVPPTGRHELSFIVRVCYNISRNSLCLRPKSHLDLSIFRYNNLMTWRTQYACNTRCDAPHRAHNIFNILPQSQLSQIEIVTKMMQLFYRQRFCELVSHLIFGGHKSDLKSLTGNPLTHEVIIHFHVLCTCMEYRISCKVCCPKIITPKMRRFVYHA
jgi:hypothetical protein